MLQGSFFLGRVCPKGSSAKSFERFIVEQFNSGEDIEIHVEEITNYNSENGGIEYVGRSEVSGKIYELNGVFVQPESSKPEFYLILKGMDINAEKWFSQFPAPASSEVIYRKCLPEVWKDSTLSCISKTDRGPMIGLQTDIYTYQGEIINEMALNKPQGTLTAYLRPGESGYTALGSYRDYSLSGEIIGTDVYINGPLVFSISLPQGRPNDTWGFSLLQEADILDFTGLLVFLCEKLLNLVDFSLPKLTEMLPESLHGLHFLLSNLDISIDAQSLKPRIMGITIQSPYNWSPFSAIVMENAGISLTFDFGEANFTTNVTVFGDIRCGENASFHSEIFVPVSSDADWELSMSGAVNFGSQAGANFTDMPMFSPEYNQGQGLLDPGDLPKDFVSLESFTLAELKMTFNPFDTTGGNKVKHIHMRAMANMQVGWEGIFTADTPKFAFSIDDPFLPQQRSFSASGDLILRFGDHLSFWVVGKYQKSRTSRQWVFHGETGKSFTIQDLADDVIKGLSAVTGTDLVEASLPSALGSIEVKNLGVTYKSALINPEQRSELANTNDTNQLNNGSEVSALTSEIIEGPSADVNWEILFPMPWGKSLDFKGSVVVDYPGGQQSSPSPNIDINLSMDLNEDILLSGSISRHHAQRSLSDGVATETSFTLSAQSNADQAFHFGDLLTCLSFDSLNLPAGFDFMLKDLSITYDSGNPSQPARLGAAMESDSFGKAVAFASQASSSKGEDAASSLYAFGLNLNADFDIGNLSALGSFMPDGLSLGFRDFSLIVSKPALPKDTAQYILKQLGISDDADQARAPWDDKATAVIGLTLYDPSGTQPFSFGFGAQGPEQLETFPSSKGSARAAATLPHDGMGSENAVTWMKFQKSFGPLSVNRVGVRFTDDGLAFPLDLAIKLGCFTIAAEGLQVGLPFNGTSSSFEISGFGISFSAPPVSAAGALHILSPQELAIWAAADTTIKSGLSGYAALTLTPEIGLSAVAGYAELEDDTAFFLFGESYFPPAGTPIFSVEGIAMGAGFNYSFNKPSLSSVAENPFVTGLFPSDNSTPIEVLKKLTAPVSGSEKPVLQIEQGAKWLGVGLTFSLAKTLHTKALAVLNFDSPVQLDMFGLSYLSLPKKSEKKLARVELAWVASFIPEELFFEAAGTLTPGTFILVDDARVEGSFWVLMSGKPGEEYFGFCIGGFAPGFDPQLPGGRRVPIAKGLEFSWAISSAIGIHGSAYYGLTPNAIMVGGSLHAQFKLWFFSAWFDFDAHFFLNWAPVHFKGEVTVSVGVSLTIKVFKWRKTFSGEFNVGVTVLGPPLHGTAHVSFMGKSLSLDFGSQGDAPSNKYITWEAFADEFLPELSERITQCALEGALSDSKHKGKKTPGFIAAVETRLKTSDRTVLFSPKGGVIEIQSAAPATQITLKGTASSARKLRGEWFALRMVGISTLSSVIDITVLHNGHPISATELQAWKFTPVERGVPSALWGEPNDGLLSLDEDPMLKGRLVGAQIVTNHGMTAGPSFEMHVGLDSTGGIGYVDIPLTDQNILPFPAPADAAPKPLSDGQSAMADVAAIAQDKSRRAETLRSLSALGVYETHDEACTVFAKMAAEILPSTPMNTKVYSYGQ